MAHDLFKEVLPSILEGGAKKFEEKSYNAFVINRALSYHIDTIFFVNLMNQKAHLSKEMQYDFLSSTIRKKKRPFKRWMKRSANEDINTIRQHYGCSYNRAHDILHVLDEEQVKSLRKLTDTGGSDKHG